MARGPQGSSSVNPSMTPTRTKNTPIPIDRSRRSLNFRGLTSMPAGKVVPLLAFPLFREDALETCRVSLGFELAEMVEVCANPVILNVRAYLVPNLAFERFLKSPETLNRSYMGIAEPGGAVVPYFQQWTTKPGPLAADNQILYYLGTHVPAGAAYNTAYNEAYNVIWNKRATDRSPDIPLVTAMGNKTLLPAFWRHPDLGSIVPNFDQATIDGEVPLNVPANRLPVRGIGNMGSPTKTTSQSVNETWSHTGTPSSVAYARSWEVGAITAGAANNIYFQEDPQANGRINVFAEMQANGITISLSNIELARKTQAFALMRKQYAGYDDQYLIDILMSGVAIPTLAQTEPILLANHVTSFGQAKRFATSADDLTASVASGAAAVNLALRTPPINTGGIVMVTAEFYPEQLWERREDPYMSLPQGQGYTVLPEFLRDTLDPEKVEIVKAKYVDVRHATPTATFGYEALHAKWNTYPPRVGGKFYRPEVDLPADEDRQRIWASETANPTLSEDFYLVTDLHTKVFVVTDQDPAEALVKGSATISGNTVFGRLLIEGEDDYDAIMAKADMTRIVKTTPLLEEADVEAVTEEEETE